MSSTLPRVSSWEQPLQDGGCPPWADAAGLDEFGPWLEFGVESRVTDSRIVQRLRWIPPGEFWMGSPRDELGRMRHERRVRAKIPSGFWLADTPVTQELWLSLMGTNPSHFAARRPDSPAWRRPVEQVSFDEVQSFLGVLNQRIAWEDAVQRPPSRFRLPREAEWGWACRALTTTAHYGQPRRLPLRRIARHCVHILRHTAPVAQLLPNVWGLYDMLGNVDEWCDDESEVVAKTRLMRSAPESCALRVIRGGSSWSIARHVRAAVRDRERPEAAYPYVGFRVALDPA